MNIFSFPYHSISILNDGYRNTGSGTETRSFLTWLSPFFGVYIWRLMYERKHDEDFVIVAWWCIIDIANQNLVDFMGNLSVVLILLLFFPFHARCQISSHHRHTISNNFLRNFPALFKKGKLVGRDLCAPLDEQFIPGHINVMRGLWWENFWELIWKSLIIHITHVDFQVVMDHVGLPCKKTDYNTATTTAINLPSASFSSSSAAAAKEFVLFFHPYIIPWWSPKDYHHNMLLDSIITSYSSGSFLHVCSDEDSRSGSSESWREKLLLFLLLLSSMMMMSVCNVLLIY